MPSEAKLGPQPEFFYRIMVWTMAVQDALGIGGLKERLRVIPVVSGMRVVDWGCGPGRYALPLAKAVGPEGKVFALDVQPLAIQIVREKATKEGLDNVEAILLDSYSAPIDTASVDLVLVLDTFHAVSDREAVLREIHRLLNPDGVLFIDPGHMNPGRARETIERTGLFALRQSWDNIWLFAKLG